MTKKVMLTTTDNPHDPFTAYEAWYVYDLASGYNTNGFLARILNDSEQLSDADQDRAITLAIDEIVRENVLGIWKKVEKEVEED